MLTSYQVTTATMATKTISKTRKAKKTIGEIRHYEDRDEALEVALHYGFSPIQQPTINKEDIKLAKQVCTIDCSSTDHSHAPHVEEKIALLRTYLVETAQTREPVLWYYEGEFPGSGRRNDSRYTKLGLEVMGSSSAMAEALLIQTARALAEEKGFTDIRLEVNSLGDKDSLAKFTRELQNYYRKHVNEMPTECRQLLKKDVFELHATHEPTCQPIIAAAPKGIDFLSDASRAHLMDLLSYIEHIDLPYTINHSLVGGKNYSTHTIFELRGRRHNNEHILGFGIRYNALARKIGGKRDVPAVGLTLCWKRDPKEKRKARIKYESPHYFFVHIAAGAKYKSLRILELLRKAAISIGHALLKDKLAAQLAHAEHVKSPHIILMGQRESVDNSVIVRTVEDRCQESVPVVKLVDFIAHQHKRIVKK
jgi:histidyl-tRNA synthetase